MRYLAFAIAAIVLAGCSWETYQNAEGRTSWRQKYESGTRVYYQDGSYSRNMQYNQYRPEQHAVKPGVAEPADVRGTSWQQPGSAE